MRYFLILFFLIIVHPNLSFVNADNNCINYLGGIGRFEISHQYFGNLEDLFLRGREFEVNYLLPNGWSLWPSNLDNFKNFKFKIDRNIYSSRENNDGSLYIEIPETTSTFTNYVLYNSIWLSPDRITTETRDYYIKSGDQLKIKLNYRFDEIQNIDVKLRVYGRWAINTSSGQTTISRDIINYYIPTTTRGSFTNIEIITGSIPYGYEIHNDVRYLERLVIEFQFIISNNSSLKKLKLWLDDLEIYALRNNDCVELPLQRSSSLNFAEVFTYVPDWGLVGDYDFIKFYKDNIKLTNSYRHTYLTIKEINPVNFKYSFYISPSTFHRYRKYNSSTFDKYRAPQGIAEIINLFDDIQIATNTNVHLDHITYRIHPNSKNPDYLSLRDSLVNYYDYPYGGTNYVVSVTHYKDNFQDLIKKFFYRFSISFGVTSYLYPDFLFIDNFGSQGSARSDLKSINLYNYFKNIATNLYPLKNYFVNVGYGSLSPSSPYLKFNLGGYMNEGWLYNPEYFNYPGNSSSLHSLFRNVVENQKLGLIFLVAGYPHYNIGGTSSGPARNCTDTQPIIRSIVSSFYLVNNPNVYVSLVPAGTIDGYDANKYGVPQCYPDSMFINLGNPLNVNNINQMIIATNSDGWYVYERKYERGKIIFNSSPNTPFSYIINWEEEPFNFYREYFSGNTYTASSTNATITIPAKSGIILYNDYNPLILTP
ncbi:MAG: hypothetical protein KatS3mg094_201 [Candidatus Parcubacteria bacterium]|nr:MAG: hypothetical protein KatS3mg094_201 [Candidatus Parcubacteria bacterium]